MLPLMRLTPLLEVDVVDCACILEKSSMEDDDQNKDRDQDQEEVQNLNKETRT